MSFVLSALALFDPKIISGKALTKQQSLGIFLIYGWIYCTSHTHDPPCFNDKYLYINLEGSCFCHKDFDKRVKKFF